MKNWFGKWNTLKANRVLAALAFILKLDQIGDFHRKRNVATSSLADILEALVGAVYLDGGHQEVKKLVARLVNEAFNKKVIKGIEVIDGEHSPAALLREERQQERFEFIGSHFYNKTLQTIGSKFLVLIVTKIVLERYRNEKVKYLQEKRSLLRKSIYNIDVDNVKFLDRDAVLVVFTELLGEGYRPIRADRVYNLLIGYVYLNEGYQEAKELVLRLVEEADIPL